MSLDDKKFLFMKVLINNHKYDFTQKMLKQQSNEDVEICNSDDFKSESYTSDEDIVDIDVNVLSNYSKSSFSEKSSSDSSINVLE